MRKYIMSILLVITAVFGVASMGGSALAGANCSLLPGYPDHQPSGVGFELPVYGTCTQVDAIRFNENLFINDPTSNPDISWYYSSTPTPLYQISTFGGQLPSSCATVNGCSFGSPNYSASNSISTAIGCPVDGHPPYPSYHNGTPYWWGHRVQFQIRNSQTGTWGSVTAWGVSGPGSYIAC